MSNERILEHQDWKTLVIRKSKKKDENKNSSKKIDDTTQKLMKVERKAENDILKHDTYTREFRLAMVDKRTNILNMTQKQLATRLNMTEKTIKDIESGKAIYNAGHYNHIKRVLKIT